MSKQSAKYFCVTDITFISCSDRQSAGPQLSSLELVSFWVTVSVRVKIRVRFRVYGYG